MPAPLPLNEVCFPTALLVDVYRQLQAKGARFATFSDLLKGKRCSNSRQAYISERIEAFAQGSRLGVLPRKGLVWKLWRKLVLERGWHAAGRWLSAQPPVVTIQHDADRFPEMTLALMQLEAQLGVRSSNYFFRRSSYGPPELERYELDIASLNQLEQAGFEVGYHLNAFENTGYDHALADTELGEDLSFFASRINLRSFVPHGGRPGPQGENNVGLGTSARLSHLAWAYNGNGVCFDMAWSDGDIEKSTLRDPRDMLKAAVNGSRLHFLLHPQYYGETLSPIWLTRPIAAEPWWQALWNLETMKPRTATPGPTPLKHGTTG